MADRFKFVFPTKFEYLTGVRLAVSSIVANKGMNISIIDDIKICVLEAIKLVGCHGKKGFAKEIELELYVDVEKIEMLISDIGSGEIEKTENDTCVKCPKDGELSTYILKALMDDVEFDTKKNIGKRIRMVKKYGFEI